MKGRTRQYSAITANPASDHSGTDSPSSDRAVAWISPYPRSRVVYIQLGHGHTSYYHPVYRALLHNAILWGAGRTPR